ncbi:MAG: flavodoxin domain-containing protein [Vicinamibacterales bacterium]
MSRVLILYGTTEGHTGRIARTIGDNLRAEEVAADVVEAGPGAPSPVHYDAVIVAASVHAGAYQKPVCQWARRYAAALNDRPSAFVSVSLGVLEKNPRVQRDVTTVVDRFLSAAGWRPTMVKMVAGALPYSRYNRMTRFIMKRIVARAGGDTDTSRDYEYTDWNELRNLTAVFAQRVRAEATAA